MPLVKIIEYRSAIPTIEYLVKRGAKVILASHLDRPSGKDLRYSLRPVSKKLGEMLSSFNAGVTFSDDCIGKDTIDTDKWFEKWRCIVT